MQYAPASNTVAEQQNQIQAMVTGGAKVIIIGAKDGKQLSTQVEAARDAGVTVIAYDRLIENTEAVDYYVAFDNFKVGQLQGQALLDGLAERAGHEAPYNIELFSGFRRTDANAPVFFNGAMDVLQPKIDDGTLKVVSGQTGDLPDGDRGLGRPRTLKRRMDSILTSTYGSETLDGVLSPNDTLARAIITSVQGAGKPVPVVTGQDSEVESVKSIMEGIQYSTINKDTTLLVEQSIKMVGQLQKGEEVDCQRHRAVRQRREGRPGRTCSTRSSSPRRTRPRHTPTSRCLLEIREVVPVIRMPPCEEHPTAPRCDREPP